MRQSIQDGPMDTSFVINWLKFTRALYYPVFSQRQRNALAMISSSGDAIDADTIYLFMQQFYNYLIWHL